MLPPDDGDAQRDNAERDQEAAVRTARGDADAFCPAEEAAGQHDRGDPERREYDEDVEKDAQAPAHDQSALNPSARSSTRMRARSSAAKAATTAAPLQYAPDSSAKPASSPITPR